MTDLASRRSVRILLGLALAALCLGRGFEHWGSAKTLYLSFLQDEALLASWLPSLLGSSWEDYVNSETLERFGRSVSWLGGAWLIATALALPWRRVSQPLILGSVGILTIAAILVARQRFPLPELLEAGIQIGLPLSYWLHLRGHDAFAKRLSLASVAACFAGHGLYAVGLYPVPGHFIDYMIDFLGASQTQALSALFVVGTLDLLAAVALFLPSLRRPALIYCAAWGLLTALARLSPAIWPLWMPENLPILLPMTLWRLAHALFPLALLFIVRSARAARSRQGLILSEPPCTIEA